MGSSAAATQKDDDINWIVVVIPTGPNTHKDVITHTTILGVSTV
jgi:hypothetical protein